jgi:hypothetical protein
VCEVLQKIEERKERILNEVVEISMLKIVFFGLCEDMVSVVQHCLGHDF